MTDKAACRPDDLRVLSKTFRPQDRVVVVAGTSVASLSLVAHLGRAAKSDPSLRIIFLTGQPLPHAKLIGGCSLRRGAVHLMAQAMNRSSDDLMERLGGRKASGFTFDMTGIRAVEDGGYELPWTRLTHSSDQSITLSTRYGNMLDGLREFMPQGLPIHLVAGEIASGAAIQDNRVPIQMSDGVEFLAIPAGRSVFLNATNNPKLLRPNVSLGTSDRVMVASQVPLRRTRLDKRIEDGVILTLRMPRSGHLPPQQIFFAPFADRDTQEAAWYGINSMLIERGRMSPKIYSAVQATLDGVCNVFGFTPVHSDRTQFQGSPSVQSLAGYEYQQQLADGLPVFDFQRAMSAGVPIAYMDGILAEVVGAGAYAEGFVRSLSGDPMAGALEAFRSSDRRLVRIRGENAFYAGLTFDMPEDEVITNRDYMSSMYSTVIEKFANAGLPRPV